MIAAGGRPRAVFDGNVVLQAVAFADGPAAGCVRAMERGAVEVLVSTAVLREIRAVLDRPVVRVISPALTDYRVAAFLDRFTFRATRVRRVPHRFDYPRDRKDEPYIDLALARRADYLVSRDNDLLSLMTSHSAVAKRFRQMSHPLAAVDPQTFLDATG